jgi:hypothetical protein
VKVLHCQRFSHIRARFLQPSQPHLQRFEATACVRAVATRESLTSVDPKARAEKAVKQVQDVPAVALNTTLVLAGKAQQSYEALAARGEDLVKRIRTQKATQDLVAQVDQTVAIGKGAVTTARKAAADTQASTKATITTGRHQAAKVAKVASDVARRQAKDAAESAEVVADAATDAAKATTTSAKRTRTTARKAAKSTTARAKATTTTAKKSAPRARKATVAAADKVGA